MTAASDAWRRRPGPVLEWAGSLVALALYATVAVHAWKGGLPGSAAGLSLVVLWGREWVLRSRGRQLNLRLRATSRAGWSK